MIRQSISQDTSWKRCELWKPNRQECSVAACVLHPREVLKKGLQYDASCFVLIHNHPSGDPTPSQADLDATIRMKKAGEMIGISLLDHLILGDYQYVSLKERGHI